MPWPNQSQLLPGALDLVRELAKRFPLALITNGIAAVQNKRFAASPITRYFKSIVISEEVGIAKPDPRIFRPALEKLGVEAADVLYVGDSITSDMAAARNAGMDFCWVNPGKNPSASGIRAGTHDCGNQRTAGLPGAVASLGKIMASHKMGPHRIKPI